MSRGLGKTQRRIHEFLQHINNMAGKDEGGGWADITAMAAYIYHPEEFIFYDDYEQAEKEKEYPERLNVIRHGIAQRLEFCDAYDKVTASQHITIYKAVKSMEKRGLLETQMLKTEKGGFWTMAFHPPRWIEFRLKS